jgi:phage portal protein BeeE
VDLEIEIKQYLNDIIDGKVPPVSREDIAKKFGVNVSYLFRKHRIQSQLATEIYQKSKRRAREQQINCLEYQIERAVSTLLSKNREVSSISVAKLVPYELMDGIRPEELSIKVEKALLAQRTKRKRRKRQ